MANKEQELLLKIGAKLDNRFLTPFKTAEGRIALLKNASKASFAAIGAGAIAAVGGISLMGKALYDLGAEFDNAEDKIRVGTGATGEALDALMNSAKAVYSEVPTSLESASSVIADYNTRLGLTGGNLEKLSKQALQVSTALGEDVTSVVENSSKIFKNFNIQEDEMSGSMDYLFKVSQSTGIGFNQLMQTMQTGGAQLQAMGYTFNESATMLGQFEKAGLDTSVMLTGLKTASQKASKDGFKTTGEAMKAYIDKIKNAKNDTEALTIASAKFGSKGGATFAKAIREGTLDIKSLQEELENSGESINSMANDTYDLSEKMTMFKNRMQVALAPIANNVFDKVSEVAEKLMPILEQKVLPLIARFSPLFDQILDCISPLIDAVMTIIDAIEPALQPIIDLVVALVQALNPLLKVLTPIIELLAKVVGWLAGGLAKGINAIVGLLNGGKGGEVAEEEGGQEIPQMANGGVVTSPTLAMIGEGGEPEAVIPLSKMGDTNSINYSPVININGDVSNDRAKEIAQITFEEFKKLYQRMMNENRRLAFA